MKNLFFKSAAAAGLLGTLAMAAPAQAGSASFVLTFGSHQAGPQVARNIGYRNGPAAHRRGPAGWHGHQGRVMPLNRVVRVIENRSGGTVTDIRLAKNRRVYQLEGVTRLGMVVEAKVDAQSGRIQSIDFKKFRPHYDPKGMDINRLIAGLRQKGFHGFDVVSLKDERGVYRVRALNKRGRPVVVRTRAQNGHVLSVQHAKNYNGPAYKRGERQSFDHWRKGVAVHGYSHFGNVSDQGDYYEVSARTRQGRTVTLDICPYTGKVLQVI